MASGNSMESKTGAVKELQGFQFAQKPQSLQGWEGLMHFLWNSETKEFLGRTGLSWIKITSFYVLYYSFLAGYFITMLVIFYQTLNDKVPKWQNKNGIIGNNPGLGFRPNQSESNIDSTLIYYRHGDENNGIGTWMDWRDRLEKFIIKYKNDETAIKKQKGNNIHVIDCDFNRSSGVGQVCKIKLETVLNGPCTLEQNYGYKEGKPCILLKLNKIYGWSPEPYLNSTDLSETSLPPSGLLDYMRKKEETSDPEIGNAVYIWCEGENPIDKETIGHIEYYPSPAIPTFYFPYYNQNEYKSPIIFAHFTNPKKGVLISIICKAWAKNIVHNVGEGVGVAHFELMID